MSEFCRGCGASTDGRGDWCGDCWPEVEGGSRPPPSVDRLWSHLLGNPATRGAGELLAVNFPGEQGDGERETLVTALRDAVLGWQRGEWS